MNYQSFIEFLGDYPLYVQMLVMAGLALAFAALLRGILFGVLRATNKRLDSFTINLIVKKMRSPVFWFTAFALLSIFWGGVPRAEQTPFYVEPATQLARTILYVAGAFSLIRAIAVIADTVRYRFNIDKQNNLTERKILTQLQYVQRIAVIIISILALAFILLQFEGVKNLGAGILTSAGVTGIIVGLAAQKSIANLLAGFQIAFTQPIRLDDALLVEGEFGRVEEITLTYVTLKLWDERRMVVPLQYFINKPFQNWTRSSSELLGTIFFYVDYTFPIQALREELESFLPTQELWDGRVKNVLVTDLKDQTMQLRVLISAVDSGSTFGLRCAVREHLIGFIQNNYPASLPKVRVTSGGPFSEDSTNHPVIAPVS